MKTLKEQVNEIKSAKMAKTAKKEALIKLGLRPYEISLIMAELPKAERKERRAIYTFGVEIECLVPRASMIAAAQSNSMPFQYEGYNHNDNNYYYKFVSDASIHGENPIECVSPILKGKSGLDSLKMCCKALNEAGAAVNRSTGLHVHIGAANISDEHYVNVFNNYKMLEGVIDSFMANSRRANNNGYCKSLRDHNFYAWFNKSDVRSELGSRYHKVNAESYNRHKTIEFRQHQGSTDFKKISAWVEFCIKLVEYSKKNRISNEVANISEIPFLNESEKRYFESRKEALN